MAYLEAVIHRYEAAVAAACKAVPTCRSDGGAFGRVVDRPEYISWDLIHLSATRPGKGGSRRLGGNAEGRIILALRLNPVDPADPTSKRWGVVVDPVEVYAWRTMAGSWQGFKPPSHVARNEGYEDGRRAMRYRAYRDDRHRWVWNAGGG